MIEIHSLRNFAIIFMFVSLFGTAAFDKFKTLSTPEWFTKQFANTFVSKLPGGARFGYWAIGIFEMTLTVAFIASAFHFGFLPYALLGASFLFGILLFGLRITYDYQGSANMFVYFTATLISFYLVTI